MRAHIEHRSHHLACSVHPSLETQTPHNYVQNTSNHPNLVKHTGTLCHSHFMQIHVYINQGKVIGMPRCIGVYVAYCLTHTHTFYLVSHNFVWSTPVQLCDHFEWTPFQWMVDLFTFLIVIDREKSNIKQCDISYTHCKPIECPSIRFICVFCFFLCLNEEVERRQMRFHI